MRTHIHTVMDRYKDDVYAWDVINEVIDGVGHQTHVSVYSNDSHKYDTFPDHLKQQQATLFKQLFDVFRRHTDTVTNVTLWGKDDNNTWLRTFPIARNN